MCAQLRAEGCLPAGIQMSVKVQGKDETGASMLGAKSFQKAAGVLRVGPGAEHRRTWPAWSSRADAGETPAVHGGNQSPDEGLACAEAGVVREGRPRHAGFSLEQLWVRPAAFQPSVH